MRYYRLWYRICGFEYSLPQWSEHPNPIKLHPSIAAVPNLEALVTRSLGTLDPDG